MTAGGAADRQRELVRQAVDGMQRPLFVLDQDFRLRYVNPAAAPLFDRPAADLVGLHVWQDFPRVAGTVFHRTYEAVAADGETRTFETFVARTGTWWRADVSRTGAGLVVTLEDVTDRVHVRQARDDAVADRVAEAERAAAAAAVAERAGRHLMLLGDVSRSFTVLTDIDAALTRLAQLCVPLLGDWCLTVVLDGDRPRQLGRAHRDPAQLPAVHRFAEARLRPDRDGTVLPEALRRGESVVLQAMTSTDVAALVSDPDAARWLVELAPAALALVPFSAGSELLGMLVLANAAGRGAFTDEELRSAGLVAQRVAEMLENARLVSAQGQMAERLQRSLLTEPVQPPHLQIAVRYRPATKGIRIGGDWHDSFLACDGSTVLVIGDVMGHDIEAAAAMGQVKTLVRGIAFDRADAPAQVLRRSDLAVEGLGVRTLATAVVARIEEPETHPDGPRWLRWASAGHPHPLLVLADGAVLDLASPVGPPLGVGWAGERSEGLVELPAGSTLLLCTDGLFERRDVGVDDGRARVRAVLSGLAAEPLEQLCDHLLATLLGEGVEDDVAVLAVRALPLPPVEATARQGCGVRDGCAGRRDPA